MLGCKEWLVGCGVFAEVFASDRLETRQGPVFATGSGCFAQLCLFVIVIDARVQISGSNESNDDDLWGWSSAISVSISLSLHTAKLACGWTYRLLDRVSRLTVSIARSGPRASGSEMQVSHGVWLEMVEGAFFALRLKCRALSAFRLVRSTQHYQLAHRRNGRRYRHREGVGFGQPLTWRFGGFVSGRLSTIDCRAPAATPEEGRS